MKVVFWIQIISIVLLFIAVTALGVEIFVNDVENIAAMQVWAIIAIVCLNINAFAAIFKCYRNGKPLEKKLAIALAFIVIIFWIAKAVRIV